MSPAHSEAEETSGAQHQRALILVVERNPAVQRLERYFLEQAGFSVEFAGDGLTALKRAQELRPKILATKILVTHKGARVKKAK